MSYPAVNAFFTATCFTFPPLLGSLVSFVWHGGAIWCCFEVVSGRRPLSRDRAMRIVSFLFLLYVAWNVLAYAADFTSLRDAPELIPLVTFLLFPFSYSVWSISNKHDIARASVIGSAIACYGAVLLACYQVFFLSMRAEGGAGNALVFAQVTAIASGICLAAAVERQDGLRHALLGAFGAGLVAIILSGSRADWVVIVANTAVVVLLYRKRLSSFANMKALVPALLVVVVLMLLWPYIWPRIHQLFLDWRNLEASGDYDSSLGVRLALLQAGTELFLARPFLGYGIHMTSTLVHDYLAAGFGVNVDYSHFHNGYLTILVQSGIVGLACVLGVLVTAGRCAIGAIRKGCGGHEKLGAAILLLLVVTYGLSGLTNKLLGHDILDTMLMVYLVIGLYLSQGSSIASRQNEAERSGSVG